jgi:hypothetical protein
VFNGFSVWKPRTTPPEYPRAVRVSGAERAHNLDDDEIVAPGDRHDRIHVARSP